MLAFEQAPILTTNMLLPRQLGRGSLASVDRQTARQTGRERMRAAFRISYERFLKVEPWQTPIAREVIHFIRMSDLAYMALRKSTELPWGRMSRDNVESVYKQDQAAVNGVLRDIGGLAVYVEDPKHGVHTWMRMVEWHGQSETTPTMHTWLPRGQEGTNNTVDLSLTALVEMEQHIADYENPAA